MPDYADLELSIHRQEGSTYAVSLRLRMPGDEADTEPGRGLATFDLDQLRQSSADARAYGQQLAAGLFGDPNVSAGFKSAVAIATSKEIPLRLRLFIGPSAAELHSLRWETLYDPAGAAPLLLGQNLLFSRFLTSPDARPVRLRPQGELKALVAIANPADLTSAYTLPAVNVQRELELIVPALNGIRLDKLVSGEKPVTLNSLVTAIDQGEPDLVYLVCHGAAVAGETWLLLEDDQGSTARVASADLLNRLKGLSQRPTLFVLASCQTAADAGAGVLAALGPRLAEAGIPAVIAMQDKISMDTSTSFMRKFFSELQRDGQIDRAVSTARADLQTRPDHWMPALFMRLRNGRLWYTPGFPTTFTKWDALLSNIESGKCTPILGGGLSDRLLGSQREIAQRWAETFRYPLFPYEREALPQVAQYLATKNDEGFPRTELERYLRRDIQRRYQDRLTPELLKPGVQLSKLLEAVHGLEHTQAFDSFKVLAGLPLPIYITANLHQLLELELREAGKDPQVVISPWNEEVKMIGSVFDKEPGYSPDPDRPMVYHLFGILDEPDSVVLTEDDYFKFLIGMATNHKDIPTAVSLALTRSALLFLGFRLDDWNFRVIYQSLLAYGGREARKKFAHVAAQVEPEEGRFLDAQSARSFLEKYFGDADINLYWGGPDDFLKVLSIKREERALAEAQETP